MDKKLRIGFVGYTDVADSYLRVFEKLGNVSFEGTYPNSEDSVLRYNGRMFNSAAELYDTVDAVIFMGEKIRKKLIGDAIRALKHVFIDDYSALMNNDIDGLYNLVKEADVTAQISMPKMYYWNIADVIANYKGVRYIQLIKEQSHMYSRLQADYIPELVAALKIIDGDVLRAHSYNVPLLSKKTELIDIRMEFSNGVNAHISSNPCGFYDVQELRLISDKAMVLLDLRKREWHSLARNSNKELQKELTSMEEVPFVELRELRDFMESIETKKEPTVSFGDMKRLQRCLTLMNENSKK